MAQERYAQWQGRLNETVAACGRGYELEHVTDTDLVRNAQEGVEKAFAAIVDRYHARIYALIYRVCGPTDAEDLTQEVFLRAMGRLHKFEPQSEASLRTWLYRIAMNLSINQLRQMKRRQRFEGLSLDAPIHPDGDAVYLAIPDSSTAPERLVERAETHRLVHAVIRQLVPKHQQVLVLVDLEGMEYEEAAAIIGCRVGTVKSRLSRAREAFSVKMRACMAVPGAK